MCGIAGIILRKRASFQLIDKVVAMNAAQRHRGPDGDGIAIINDQIVSPFYIEIPVNNTNCNLNYLPVRPVTTSIDNPVAAFAHRRLSIIDIGETGHQPMCDHNGEIWITYNGEVYNYKELKEELTAIGHRFVSQSDTEVIIEAYKEWGEKCVERFNGMWAFCLYDSVKQHYFFSRDRLGVKPLYLLINEDKIAFASEQKAFVRSGLLKANYSRETIYSYLSSNTLEHQKNNFFEGLTELWPGYNLVFESKTNELREYRYFDLNQLDQSANEKLSDKELLEKIKEKLFQAIRLRLRSDVEVGTCLSGGIDSSTIACIIHALNDKELNCFTSVFRNGATNEEKFADEVSKKIHARQHKTEPNVEEFKKDVHSLVFALDAPIWDSSTYAQFRVMRLAQENQIKVVLDGQGADELFAGYHHHFIAKWNQHLKEDGFLSFYGEISKSRETIPHPFLFYIKQKAKYSFLSSRSANNSFLKSGIKTSISFVNTNIFPDNVNNSLITDCGPLRLKSFLRCEDRCGMWHSVESRTPFSDDIELIDLLFSFNGKRKIKDGVSKYFLRESVKDILPETIYKRKDKIGFEAPMSAWISEMRTEMLNRVLESDFDFIENDLLIKGDFTGNKLHQHMLFKLYILSVWREVFEA